MFELHEIDVIQPFLTRSKWKFHIIHSNKYTNVAECKKRNENTDQLINAYRL